MSIGNPTSLYYNPTSPSQEVSLGTVVVDSLYSFAVELFEKISSYFSPAKPQISIQPKRTSSLPEGLSGKIKDLLSSKGIDIEETCIGEGTVAAIYKGSLNKKPMAVKIMHKLRESFEREGGEALALSLPKKSPVQKNKALVLYDAKNDELIYVTEDNLNTVPEKELFIVATISKLREGDLEHAASKLSIAELKAHALTTAEGIEKLHSEGIAHRDLHAGNLLLDSKGVKVTDFGNATRDEEFFAFDWYTFLLTFSKLINDQSVWLTNFPKAEEIAKSAQRDLQSLVDTLFEGF